MCALGLQDQLVGRAHECDYPAVVRNLPVCSDVNFPVDGSSSDIDSQVREKVKAGDSLYKINSNLISRLEPEIIIAQSHCKVCAVSSGDLTPTLNQLKKKPELVSLTPHRLSDVFAGIRDIARAARVPKRGEQLVRRLEGRFEKVKLLSEDLPDKPRVLCVEWIDPVMTSGNWVPELIEMAGGVPVGGGKAGELSPQISWKDVVRENPDVILISPCGFDLEKTRAEVQAFLHKPEWLNLKAVLNNRVFLVDGNQYVNRPGPRLAETAEIFAELLHPTFFRFGYQGEAWEYCGLAG